MLIFVSPELSSERDYVITHSVRSMYVVCSIWYFAKLITASTYIDVFPWDLDTMLSLGRVTHVTSTDVGSKGHLGVNDLWLKFLKKVVIVSTYFDVLSWDLDMMILG